MRHNLTQLLSSHNLWSLLWIILILFSIVLASLRPYSYTRSLPRSKTVENKLEFIKCLDMFDSYDEYIDSLALYIRQYMLAHPYATEEEILEDRRELISRSGCTQNSYKLSTAFFVGKIGCFDKYPQNKRLDIIEKLEKEFLEEYPWSDGEEFNALLSLHLQEINCFNP